MNIKRNRQNIMFGSCLVFLLFFGTIYAYRIRTQTYRLEVIPISGQGYGYTIKRGGRMVIYQPFIPALPHKRCFLTAGDAEKVGSLVLRRIRNREDFSITEEDLAFCLPPIN